jgi:hypothetical protein
VILNLSKQDRAKLYIENEWLKGNFKSIFSGINYQFGRIETFELLSGDYLVYQSI